MIKYLKAYKYQFLLWVFILLYSIYFSYYTIQRYLTLYSSYFDLGIMHQTVFNTYRAIASGDWSRFLELTNPLGSNQIIRMVIHNDMLLALLSPFYFISSSPITLLVIQTVVLALGALFIYKISQVVFKKSKYKNLFSVIFSFCYLMYPPLQRGNNFDFHAVMLAATFLLAMFYFWLIKKYRWSFLFFILAILSKEQVALTTLFFGLYALYKDKKSHKSIQFGLLISAISIVWFAASIFLIIPFFRGSQHFALSYFGDFGESPGEVLINILRNPGSVFSLLWQRYRYFLSILGPLGFVSLFSPLELLIAAPEFAINLLSRNSNLRNIYYHYTAVLHPFVFISAISGSYYAINLFTKKYKLKAFPKALAIYVVVCALLFSYFEGPLPFAKKKEIHPFKYPAKESKDTRFWSEELKDERLKISATGKLTPFFTGRRYFYTFSKNYQKADYVVLRLNEIYNYPEKEALIPVYEQLVQDPNYRVIYQKQNFEVYKRIGM